MREELFFVQRTLLKETTTKKIKQNLILQNGPCGTAGDFFLCKELFFLEIQWSPIGHALEIQ